MDQLLLTDQNLNYFAVLLDITPEEFSKAMADTGMSGEEIVTKYFEQML